MGYTLDPTEIDAIQRGEKMRTLVERHLAAAPLAVPDEYSRDALELLAWMVARQSLVSETG